MHNNLTDEIIRYAEIISRIRELSSIASSDTLDADDYENRLRENFLVISGLGVESRRIVTDTISPILKKPEPLTEAETEALYILCEKLLDPYSEEELDLDILDQASMRLYREAEGLGDDDALIHAMYVCINSCYANMIRTNRVRVDAGLSVHYRDTGIQIAREMLRYLDHDRFAAISATSRRYVLIHSRFYLALFDTFYVEEDINRERLEGLWKSFALSENPFYVELTPDYDWNYHRIRCLENMGQLTERGNAWCFTEAQLQQIYAGVLKLREIWEENPEQNNRILPKVQLELVSIRNRYFAGELTKPAYEKLLMEFYAEWSNHDYDSYALVGNILTPIELLAVIDRDSLTDAEAAFIQNMYLQIIEYVQHSKNTESFYFMLDYLSGFLDVFMEIPGAITFEEMALCCIAAIHPPTYVHSLQVAQISVCLGRHLYSRKPSLFAARGLEASLDLLYHAGLCHDFGKIAMLDTIFVYGRSLSDLEFSVIKAHPVMSAFLLEKFPSTSALAPFVAAHHLWHNGSGGYPRGLTVTEENQPIVDILCVADSIDAATDSIGRSYNRGKNLQEIIDDLKHGSGTRYSADLIALLDDSDVAADLLFYINTGRNMNYRNTYLLLSRSSASALSTALSGAQQR